MDGTNKMPRCSSISEWIKNTLSRTLKVSNCIPKHVGFVMDGNRRYARKNEMEIKEGHEAGFESMSRVLELCYESGVTTATVFAFSIENFNRSAREVDLLMKLAREKIRQIAEHGEMAQRYGIRIRVIGDLSLLPKNVLKSIEETTELTKANSRGTLNICFPYTGREEIFHSIKKSIEIATDSQTITESMIEQHLYTGELPQLDLLIRTSGVTRLSDFMLWQVSNKGVVIELFDCLWPEFGPMNMAWSLLKFAFRKYFSVKDNKLEEDYDEEDEEQEDSVDNREAYSVKKNM
ncbi:hypothetical protein HG535_0C02330 [Zygotorulaspora mrakii]|uniref:Alkyl transferase n=1 Tax=Zygotorulaspora mrakii TaxID=42260 RepID=A0A7H9B068_ZYGMR|nr:uncharacterized protein HG535_0C02330 [Zygotorulaspora mrakii]QLG71883.1 hypothetical protein HG535_0C02330 [Zygotorulaspora mrakii]